MTLTRLGPGGRIVEAAHELPEMTGTTGDVIADAGDETLEVGRHVSGHLDPQRCRLLLDAAESAGEPRRARVPLGHVVAGEQIDPAIVAGDRRVLDDGHEVGAGKVVHLGEVRPQHRGRYRLVDARSGQQRRDDVDVRGRSRVDARPRVAR